MDSMRYSNASAGAMSRVAARRLSITWANACNPRRALGRMSWMRSATAAQLSRDMFQASAAAANRASVVCPSPRLGTPIVRKNAWLSSGLVISRR